jgi:gamma-F420-2:alpha-L-glutamate ligase
MMRQVANCIMPCFDTTIRGLNRVGSPVGISDHVVMVTKSSPRAAIRRLLKEMTNLGLHVEICAPNRFSVLLGEIPALTYNGKPFVCFGVILTRTCSGTHAPILLRQMEIMGMRVINKLRAILSAIDKTHTMQLAATAGIPIPGTLIHSANNVVAEWTLGYPCIVKIPTGSCGRGVILINDANQLKAFFEFVNAIAPCTLLVQEYVADQIGADLRVLVVNGKAIGAMLRRSKNGEPRANASLGGVASLIL